MISGSTLLLCKLPQTRFIGETASKLRLIFDHIKQTRAFYLFDEFDAIGTQRGAQNDVEEIRRVLNSFLLFVEQDASLSNMTPRKASSLQPQIILSYWTKRSIVVLMTSYASKSLVKNR